MIGRLRDGRHDGDVGVRAWIAPETRTLPTMNPTLRPSQAESGLSPLAGALSPLAGASPAPDVVGETSSSPTRRDKLRVLHPLNGPPRALSLAAFVDAGIARWPSLPIDRAAFAAHVAALAPASLDHAGDVALTFACAGRSDAAIRILDPIVQRAVASGVAKLDVSPSFVDDVAQKLREKLLLSTPPRIGTYSGRASLRTWLQMAGLRTALNIRRRRDEDARAHSPLTTSCDAAAPDADLSFLRARYRGDFASALKGALASLTTDERRLLRRYVVERATLAELSASHGVAISTISRRLQTIRDRIAGETKTRLRGALHLTSSEYEGVAELVRSDVDVSVASLLHSSRMPR